MSKTEGESITMEDVLSSGLIPDAGKNPLIYLGKGWYKDSITGTAYHIVKGKDRKLSIKETRQSSTKTAKSMQSTLPHKPRTQKEKKASTVDIKCIDCGATRTIKVQDAFQVKRCMDCQSKYRKARRAEVAKKKKEDAVKGTETK